MGFFLPIANLIDLLLENWIISAAVLAVFASLCLGLFKGVKHGIRAMAVLLAVAITALLGMIIYYFAVKDIEGLIKFGIAWFPTIIFLIAVTLSTLVGIRRGLRKSLILMLHSVIVAGVCLGLFFFCVTSATFDRLLLSFINMFLGENGLQNKVGVSSDCETLREVLMDFIGSYVVDLGEFGVLLGANGAYVLALVNMIYRLVFAVIFFFIYELLLFIMYIIYLIFYSERKYKKKRNIRFAMNKTDSSYKKRPVGGGCVGLVRGMLSGIISLSFIGSVFFIAVGGSGASKLPEDFGDDSSPLISIYRSIEDYGEQGIFKILNAINDPEDTPYYLFAADIVFSGGLDDELHDVSGTVRFRKELAAYTGFAKNTLALLLKYDTNGEIAKILNGGGGGDTMETVLNVFVKHEFRVEFKNLIDNFDSQTYIINFALSLADAVIANVDNVSFMQSLSADNKELLQVLFRRNYLSDTIPDERDRKYSWLDADTEEVQPYININHLLTKRDAQIVLDIVLSLVANEIDVTDPHSIAKQLIPNIEELSIISSRRSAEMDPVLGRMYCYFENKYLTNDGERGITYAEVKDESVKWTRELRALLSVADGLVSMYDKVQNRGESNIFKTVLSLFDEDSPDYAENVKMYEELTDVVSDSAIMSKVLCSSKIYNFLNDQLKNINSNIYYPQKISYENKYDEEGRLVAHGEAYQLLRGLRLMAEKENREIIDSLTGSASFEDLIKKLSSTVTRDDPFATGNSLASYLTESTLFRSVLSTFIMEKAGSMLVVPKLSLETDANAKRVNLINKYELREVLDALPDLTDLILPLAEEEVSAEAVNKILGNETFRALLDNGNKIVEGTIAKSLIDMLNDNDEIIITRRLENYEEWVTVNTPGELRKFLKTQDILDLDVEALMNGGGLDGTEILNKIKNLDDTNITELFDSDVFYYSASRMLDRGEFIFEDFEVIVTTSSCKPLVDEKIERVIKKDELMSVFINLKDFGLTSGMNSENILRKLVEQHEVLGDSDIISASVVNFIVSKEAMREALDIPEFYLKEATKARLREYDTANPWRSELPSLIAAIDEIFGLSNMSEEEEFVFNSTNTATKTKNILMLLNENSTTQPRVKKLDVCYASEIIQNIITKELDKALNGSDQTDESLIDIKARDGLKTSTRAVRVYPKSEIGNLITALNVLGFGDIDEVKADRFDSLTQYKAHIDVVANSGIVRGIITKKIDAAITDGEGGIIDTNVKTQIKNKEYKGGVYTAAEVKNLVYALDEFGMDDFNVLSGYDFSENMKNLSGPSKADSEVTKLSVIYRSDLVAGILTKTIKDTFQKSSLVYHPSAERADLAVVKEKELNSLISLLGNRSLGDFNVNDLSMSNIRNQLAPESDKSSAPNSYLIAANFAKTATGNEMLYVPSSVYRDNIITPAEAVKFIDAIIALQGESQTLGSWNVDASMILPDSDDRAKVLASDIMRATFSHTVFTLNSGVAFSQSKIRPDSRAGATAERIAVISSAQLEYLFEIIESIGGSKQLSIPVFSNPAAILSSPVSLDLLCNFDATRYSISQLLISLGGKAGKESWYKFDSSRFELDDNTQVMTADDIKSKLQN